MTAKINGLVSPYFHKPTIASLLTDETIDSNPVMPAIIEKRGTLLTTSPLSCLATHPDLIAAQVSLFNAVLLFPFQGYYFLKRYEEVHSIFERSATRFNIKIISARLSNHSFYAFFKELIDKIFQESLPYANGSTTKKKTASSQSQPPILETEIYSQGQPPLYKALVEELIYDHARLLDFEVHFTGGSPVIQKGFSELAFFLLEPEVRRKLLKINILNTNISFLTTRTLVNMPLFDFLKNLDTLELANTPYQLSELEALWSPLVCRTFFDKTPYEMRQLITRECSTFKLVNNQDVNQKCKLICQDVNGKQHEFVFLDSPPPPARTTMEGAYLELLPALNKKTKTLTLYGEFQAFYDKDQKLIRWIKKEQINISDLAYFCSLCAQGYTSIDPYTLPTLAIGVKDLSGKIIALELQKLLAKEETTGSILPFLYYFFASQSIAYQVKDEELALLWCEIKLETSTIQGPFKPIAEALISGLLDFKTVLLFLEFTTLCQIGLPEKRESENEFLTFFLDEHVLMMKISYDKFTLQFPYDPFEILKGLTAKLNTLSPSAITLLENIFSPFRRKFLISTSSPVLFETKNEALRVDPVPLGSEFIDCIRNSPSPFVKRQGYAFALACYKAQPTKEAWLELLFYFPLVCTGETAELKDFLLQELENFYPTLRLKEKNRLKEAMTQLENPLKNSIEDCLKDWYVACMHLSIDSISNKGFLRWAKYFESQKDQSEGFLLLQDLLPHSLKMALRVAILLKDKNLKDEQKWLEALSKLLNAALEIQKEEKYPFHFDCLELLVWIHAQYPSKKKEVEELILNFCQEKCRRNQLDLSFEFLLKAHELRLITEKTFQSVIYLTDPKKYPASQMKEILKDVADNCAKLDSLSFLKKRLYDSLSEAFLSIFPELKDEVDLQKKEIEKKSTRAKRFHLLTTTLNLSNAQKQLEELVRMESLSSEEKEELKTHAATWVVRLSSEGKANQSSALLKDFHFTSFLELGVGGKCLEAALAIPDAKEAASLITACFIAFPVLPFTNAVDNKVKKCLKTLLKDHLSEAFELIRKIPCTHDRYWIQYIKSVNSSSDVKRKIEFWKPVKTRLQTALQVSDYTDYSKCLERSELERESFLLIPDIAQEGNSKSLLEDFKKFFSQFLSDVSPFNTAFREKFLLEKRIVAFFQPVLEAFTKNPKLEINDFCLNSLYQARKKLELFFSQAKGMNTERSKLDLRLVDIFLKASSKEIFLEACRLHHYLMGEAVNLKNPTSEIFTTLLSLVRSACKSFKEEENITKSILEMLKVYEKHFLKTYDPLPLIHLTNFHPDEEIFLLGATLASKRCDNLTYIQNKDQNEIPYKTFFVETYQQVISRLFKSKKPELRHQGHLILITQSVRLMFGTKITNELDLEVVFNKMTHVISVDEEIAGQAGKIWNFLLSFYTDHLRPKPIQVGVSADTFADHPILPLLAIRLPVNANAKALASFDKENKQDILKRFNLKKPYEIFNSISLFDTFINVSLQFLVKGCVSVSAPLAILQNYIEAAEREVVLKCSPSEYTAIQSAVSIIKDYEYLIGHIMDLELQKEASVALVLSFVWQHIYSVMEHPEAARTEDLANLILKFAKWPLANNEAFHTLHLYLTNEIYAKGLKFNIFTLAQKQRDAVKLYLIEKIRQT